MRIMIDFHGGPVDGATFVLEREIESGELTFEEMIVMLAGSTSGYNYNIGHHFYVPSPGWLSRTAVRRDQRAQTQFMAFEYEITARLDGNEELLLVAKLVGQK